jgi:hypothetical protein
MLAIVIPAISPGVSVNSVAMNTAIPLAGSVVLVDRRSVLCDFLAVVVLPPWPGGAVEHELLPDSRRVNAGDGGAPP